MTALLSNVYHIKFIYLNGVLYFDIGRKSAGLKARQMGQYFKLDSEMRFSSILRTVQSTHQRT